ncbi:hypothetical protein G6F59_017646 [Rhizopus arrhizus]|nr:hypothetical protein G6F59_017646 [Rhizopus arrhizus]
MRAWSRGGSRLARSVRRIIAFRRPHAAWPAAACVAAPRIPSAPRRPAWPLPAPAGPDGPCLQCGARRIAARSPATARTGTPAPARNR